MALINCPECGIEISDKATACPKCAFPIAKHTDSPSEINVGNVTLQEPSNRNSKWKHISWISYLAIGLLFLLPFCDISCSGRKIVSLTGSVLATGATITPAILGNEIGEAKDMPANLYAILALTSIILGFLLTIIYPNTNILSGLLGLASAGFLIALQVTINRKLDELQINLFTANFTVAYWIALIGGIFIAIINLSTSQHSKISTGQLILLLVWASLDIIIMSSIAAKFDPTAPFQFRPIISASNSEFSLFSFGPSPKEREEKRIADSIRVADSLAMVQAEQQRIADSIATAQGGNNASSQKSDEIIVSKIKQVIEDYYRYSRNNNEIGPSNIFSNPVERYFSQTNVTPDQISSDKKKYAQRFSLLNVDIDYNTLKISANDTRDNFTVSYDISVIVKNLSSEKKTKFNENISLKINSEYRIYYITEQINSKEVMND